MKKKKIFFKKGKNSHLWQPYSKFLNSPICDFINDKIVTPDSPNFSSISVLYSQACKK